MLIINIDFKKLLFTGDTFGLCYPDLQEHGVFVLPSTSPIDYNPIEAKKSVDKILAFQPQCLFLTHFGVISQIEEAKIDLLKNLGEEPYLGSSNRYFIKSKTAASLLKSWIGQPSASARIRSTASGLMADGFPTACNNGMSLWLSEYA